MPTADSSWKIYANAQPARDAAEASSRQNANRLLNNKPGGVMPAQNNNEMVARQNADRLLNDKPGAMSPEVKIPRQGMGVTANDATSGSTTTTNDAVVGTPWTLEGDPLYQQALAQGQSKFNLARNQAMFNLNDVTAQTNQDRRSLDLNSTEARRRLAGNYAARGMAGGAAGALGLAEAEANARQIASQTSLKDKLAALNANFLENYGNANTVDAAGKSNFDWTGTLAGQGYKTDAAQAAITARLAQYGVA